jgi:hypothetical protein
MSTQLDAIWQQIENLTEDDRLVLGQRLHDLAESQWREEATTARQLAAQQGLIQQSIDDAVDELRYGS